MMESYMYFMLYSCWLLGGALGNNVCRETWLGAEYSGDVAVTISGNTCQSWDSDTPHAHSWHSVPGNLCRNPDDTDIGPWCFTVNTDVRWDQCDIPRCNEEIQSSSSFLTKAGLNFDGDLLVDRDPTNCQPVTSATAYADLVLRADLGTDAAFASVEVVVDTSDGVYADIVSVYTNTGELYDGLFSGFFHLCQYLGHKTSGHVTNARLYYYCDCPSSTCRYVFFRVEKGDYNLHMCEVHVYPNENYPMGAD